MLSLFPIVENVPFNLRKVFPSGVIQIQQSIKDKNLGCGQFSEKNIKNKIRVDEKNHEHNLL